MQLLFTYQKKKLFLGEIFHILDHFSFTFFHKFFFFIGQKKAFCELRRTKLYKRQYLLKFKAFIEKS